MWNPKILVLGLVTGLTYSSLLVGQQSPHCAQNLFCLFNQKAAVPNSAGIHKYSEDLIGLIVPSSVDATSVSQAANHLADRLAGAEQTARTGGGKLVPETAVVKAFNNLMQEIGAPPSMRASEVSVHGFREHAASIKAFPALFSANRNGARCNPGEAVFLLYLLISDNGILHEGNLDSAQALMAMNSQRIEGYGVAYMEGLGLGAKGSDSSASGLLSLYPSHHNRNATIALFNHVADMLGF